MSRSQEVVEGGVLLFHNNSILCRARSEVNETMFLCLEESVVPGPGTPNIAMSGHSSMSCPNISEIILKYDFQ